MLNNILKIFTGTFVSRIFGFVRDLIVAAYFGTSKISDAFTFALTFPNLLRQILGEDMVERAFMPPFKTIYDKGEIKSSWRFLSAVFNWFFFILLGATFLFYLIIPLGFKLLPQILELFNGFFPEYFNTLLPKENFNYDLALKLIFILIPFMLFIGLAAFIGSILNFFEKNWIFGFAPLMLSVGVILSVITLEPFIGGYSIAVGYVLGAFLQFAVQVPFLFNSKFKKETEFKYHKIMTDKDHDFSIIKRESKIITLNAVFNKSSELVGRFIATTLATGSLSSLYFAMRLYQLPFAIISLPIARGINPALNRMKSNNDFKSFNKTFNRGLDLYLLIFIPVTTICIIASAEIVEFAFRRDKFDINSVLLTSRAFIMYVLGLLPMSLVGYYSRILSLFNKNKYALQVSVISALVNISFALALIKFTNMNHAAIALASSISFTANMFLMNRYIKIELKDFIVKDYSRIKNSCGMIILLVLIVFANFYFELNYYANHLQSLTSLIVKTLIVFSIFGIYIVIQPKYRNTILDFSKKFRR